MRRSWRSRKCCRAGTGHLGIKYEAAAHYNLGLAYRRSGQESLAVGEFRQMLEVWPVSECARRAQICLKRKPDAAKEATDNPNNES
jgi:hypothetical protein